MCSKRKLLLILALKYVKLMHYMLKMIYFYYFLKTSLLLIEGKLCLYMRRSICYLPPNQCFYLTEDKNSCLCCSSGGLLISTFLQSQFCLPHQSGMLMLVEFPVCKLSCEKERTDWRGIWTFYFFSLPTICLTWVVAFAFR